MSTLKATNIKNDSSASNNIVLDSSGGVVVSGVTTVSAGSASSPAITPSGDSNTGIFFPSADTIAFAEGGVESIRIDSSGRLGIGTVSPSYLLHLNGTSNVESRAITSGASSTAQWGAQNTTGATVVMGAGGSSYSPYGVIGVSNAYVYTGSDLAIATDGANAIKFATGAGVPERARIDSSGRLLVGTSTARSNIVQFADPYFQIEGTYRQSISVVNNENNANAGGIALSKIRGTGIVSNGDISGLISFGGYDGSTFRETANIQGVIDGTPGANDMPGRLVFATTADGASSPTERMRIGNNGNVLFTSNTVTVASSSGTGDFYVQGANAAGANARIFLTCPGSNEGSIWYERSTSRLYIYSQSGGVYLGSTATSWTANSDERLKDIIEPIENAANKVSSLRAVIGKYKTDEEGTRRSFLIAQDVQAVLPEAVDASNPNSLGVSYTDVIPLLVAAIKEQQAVIAELQAKVAALESA